LLAGIGYVGVNADWLSESS